MDQINCGDKGGGFLGAAWDMVNRCMGDILEETTGYKPNYFTTGQQI
jgi:hypothetical protein